MKLRRMSETRWLGFFIGTVASNCGGGVTSGGGTSSMNDAGSVSPAAGEASSAEDGRSPAALDSGPREVPQAFATVQLGAYYDPNHNMQNTCRSFMSLRELFAIGSTTGNCDPVTGQCNGTGPVRLKDGSQSGGAIVNIRCSVTGGYDIDLEASLGSTGTLQIVGHVDATAGGQGLSADIGYQAAHYSSSTCNVTFMYGGAPVPQRPPIAPGRIWGHLSCPQMGDPDGVRHVVLMDMSQVPEVCDGEVDFVFENCTQ